MTDTNDIIANQLAENTGRAMMDSGDYYGRRWEINQAAAKAAGVTQRELFDGQPNAYWDGYMVILSAYHWMTEHLDHADDMQRRLDRWINLGWLGLDKYARGPETNHPGTIDAWLDKLIAHKWAEPHPEFDGWTNTYNHENLLSQDLQFRMFATTDKHPLGADSFVAMSTHNGCDARGGYSDFKIYRCDPWEMFDWDDYAVHCDKCEQHPADPDTTLFDQKPYVAESYGLWYHRHGDWDTDAPQAHWTMKPIFEPRWDAPDWDMPDDFEQTGPICPIHHCNMEVG